MKKILFFSLLSLGGLWLFFSQPQPVLAYCGDGTCEATEDCTSCSTDCGACPTATPIPCSQTYCPAGCPRGPGCADRTYPECRAGGPECQSVTVHQYDNGCGWCTYEDVGTQTDGGCNCSCTPGRCNQIQGCDCYQDPNKCGLCDNWVYCQENVPCPGDPINDYSTLCTPNCVSPTSCYDTPTCSSTVNCNDPGVGGDAYCNSLPGGGCPGGCVGEGKCGSGGNCYTDCTACSTPAHLECIAANWCGLVSGSGSNLCTDNAGCPGGVPPPPPPPPPPPSGTLQGRLWNDLNLNSVYDAGEGGSYLIQNPAGICGAYTSLDTYISFLGPTSGIRLPGLCSPDPYYSVSLPTGTYSVWSVPPAEWLGTVVSQTADITDGGTVDRWFGMTPIPPTCSISGPTIIFPGETGNWSATGQVPGGTGAGIEIDRNQSAAFPGTNYTQMGTAPYRVDCPGQPTCGTLASWTTTMSDIGNWNIFCRGWHSNLRECRPWPGVYPENTDCGGTDVLTVEVRPPGAWFQVDSGDVHVQGDLSGPVPLVASPPYFSLESSGQPGIVSANGSATFSPGTVSSTGWFVGDPPATYSYDDYVNKKYNYAYFRNKPIPNPNSLAENPTQPVLNSLGSASGSYYEVGGTGNLNVPYNAPWSVGNNRKIVIFVPGNLTIKRNIRLGGTNSFIAFFVGGNITITSDVYDNNPTTAVLEGVYLANGTISTGVTDRRLLARGIFVAHGGFQLQRDNRPQSNDPAEKFLYDPNILMKIPPELWSADFIWQEVAP